VKKSLKQIVFKPSQLKTKHLILSPKIEPPQIPKIVPYTPNLKSSRHAHSHEKPKENPKHQLLPPLMDAFVIEHVPPKLLLDPFMMWHLHRVNHEWHKVMGEPLEWHALNIVKYHNLFYCHNIGTQGLPRWSLKQCLQFELQCFKLCFLDDASILDFCLKFGFETSYFFELFR